MSNTASETSSQAVSSRVIVSADKLSAQLTIDLSVPLEEIDRMWCMAMFQDRDIQLTSLQTKLIEETVAQWRQSPPAERVIVLEGRAPVEGRDGFVEWDPLITKQQEAVSSNEASSDQPAPEKGDSDQDVDHYNRSLFVTVKKDQVLATIHDPVDGVDGLDVYGELLPSYRGVPCQVKIDDTILMNAHGVCSAQMDGVLRVSGNQMSVVTTVVIDDYVDFSTGHVKVPCDVEVMGGVRDCFEIVTPTDLTVHGLIEAATICTGGDVWANAGMAAKEKGSVDVGGTLTARYLENVTGHIQRDVVVDKSILNSSLQIDGRLNIERGSLIGSCLHVIDRSVVGKLGTEGGERTVLALGSSPRMSGCLAEVAELIESMTSQAETYQERLDMLSSVGARATSSQKEELTEVMCELGMVQSDIDRLNDKRSQLSSIFEAMRCVDLRIERRAFPGALVVVDDQVVQFDQAFKGPLRIHLDEDGKTLLWTDLIGGTTGPLSQHMKIRSIESRAFQNIFDAPSSD